MEYKQAIIIRTDLKMSKGKCVAQGSHASLDAVMNSNSKIVSAWRAEGGKKVVLKVTSEKELLQLHKLAKAEKLSTALIRDAGLTEVKPGTLTALGIGPNKENKIDKITSKLKML